jgi:hypothetical protein
MNLVSDILIQLLGCTLLSYRGKMVEPCPIVQGYCTLVRMKTLLLFLCLRFHLGPVVGRGFGRGEITKILFSISYWGKIFLPKLHFSKFWGKKTGSKGLEAEIT